MCLLICMFGYSFTYFVQFFGYFGVAKAQRDTSGLRMRNNGARIDEIEHHRFKYSSIGVYRRKRYMNRSLNEGEQAKLEMSHSLPRQRCGCGKGKNCICRYQTEHTLRTVPWTHQRRIFMPEHHRHALHRPWLQATAWYTMNSEFAYFQSFSYFRFF